MVMNVWFIYYYFNNNNNMIKIVSTISTMHDL